MKYCVKQNLHRCSGVMETKVWEKKHFWIQQSMLTCLADNVKSKECMVSYDNNQGRNIALIVWMQQRDLVSHFVYSNGSYLTLKRQTKQKHVTKKRESRQLRIWWCLWCCHGHDLVFFSSHSSSCLKVVCCASDAVNSQWMVVNVTSCSVICCPASWSHMGLQKEKLHGTFRICVRENPQA